MAHSYEELHGLTVAALREVAKDIEHDELHGYTTMHKEQLLLALCKALGLEAHVHHEVVGINKKATKAEIRDLKVKRLAALEAKDGAELKRIRLRIHRLKRKLRSATV
jgi:hypothetical protein